MSLSPAKEEIPNPSEKPWDYLRFLARSRRHEYGNEAGNMLLDAIGALSKEQDTAMEWRKRAESIVIDVLKSSPEYHMNGVLSQRVANLLCT